MLVHALPLTRERRRVVAVGHTPLQSAPLMPRGRWGVPTTNPAGKLKNKNVGVKRERGNERGEGVKIAGVVAPETFQKAMRRDAPLASIEWKREMLARLKNISSRSSCEAE